MSDLNEYTVVIGGLEHTMQLSDDDAERLGAVKKSGQSDAEPDAKAATAQNKARTANDK